MLHCGVVQLEVSEWCVLSGAAAHQLALGTRAFAVACRQVGQVGDKRRDADYPPCVQSHTRIMLARAVLRCVGMRDTTQGMCRRFAAAHNCAKVLNGCACGARLVRLRNVAQLFEQRVGK